METRSEALCALGERAEQVFRELDIVRKRFYFIFTLLYFFVFLPFLGPLLWQMELPRLGAKSEL